MSASEQNQRAPGSSTLPDHVERVHELRDFALAKLPSMQLADGAFCHEVDAEAGRRATGRSLRSTLIALIGLLRADERGLEQPFHLGALRARVLAELGAPELTAGDFGLALWAESRSDGGAEDEIVALLDRALPGTSPLDALSGDELAWVVIGLTESEAAGQDGAGEQILASAREQLLGRATESGLFAHVTTGPRRRFPNFATQIYAIQALAKLARFRDDTEARLAAQAAGERLLSLQLPDGGWPWLYDSVRGTIVEPYAIYSVHQDAMAPMAMHGLSEATGDERYRAAAVYGLDWIWGRNELEAQMLDRDTGMIYRSIRRRERLDRAYLFGRTAVSYVRSPKLKDARKTLEVNRTDRPYHLGWILEAWAGREDLAAL